VASEADSRPTTIALSELPPAEIPVGADLVFTVRLCCPTGGDLHGGSVKVMAGEEVAATRELRVRGEGGVSETEPFTLTAPLQIGDYVWTVLFPRQEIDGIIYEQSVVPISFKTKPRATSLAVWDTPSPVVMGERFNVKVGAKSTTDYHLEGACVDIVDERGIVVGSGVLGKEPWPGTTALFWTEVSLTAPEDERTWSWSARFSADKLGLPHDGASGAFSFFTTRPPEHVVEVIVVVKDTEATIRDAEVRLGRHRGATNEAGVVRLSVPKGTYDLIVWKVGYEITAREVEVTQNVTIRVEGKELTQEDPYADLYT